jgi:DNA-directed RNA polymerase subunit RPC12/RpoP
MPQRILCSECGEVLYEGELLKSPQDIIKKYEGKCPSCGKRLEFDTEQVKIRPCESI